MNFTIRQTAIEDIKDFTRHCIFHMREKGIGGIYVHPFSSSHIWNEEEFSANLIKKWSSEPFSPNWEIAWVAIVEGKFVGHINLRCGGIEAQKHRMRLGMGIENSFRSMGIGKSLLNKALSWAKGAEEISWIDLSVFSKNEVARKLYANMGFVATHTIEDALRVDGESIDDIQMVLKLR